MSDKQRLYVRLYVPSWADHDYLPWMVGHTDKDKLNDEPIKEIQNTFLAEQEDRDDLDEDILDLFYDRLVEEGYTPIYHTSLQILVLDI